MTKPECAADTKLENCPFCGGEASKGMSSIWCSSCGACSKEDDFDGKCIVAWNTRSTPPLPADVQGLAKAFAAFIAEAKVMAAWNESNYRESDFELDMSLGESAASLSVGIYNAEIALTAFRAKQTATSGE